MQVFSDELIRKACSANSVTDLSRATIGETVLVAGSLEKETGIPFVRMDQGSPGLPMNRYGIEAEKRALDRGVGAKYPPAGGIPELKEAASRFVKAFIDVDVSPRSCIPTVGSVHASFGAALACASRIPGKDKILFIDPGFPIQKAQLRLLGIGWYEFDVFGCRGAAPLEAKLREMLDAGDVAALLYSNPNNPAWTCLEEEELEVIGRLATEYDIVVLEDLAYFGMDFRRNLGRPFEPPFVPTVARYTDNYILMLTSSKIFSYAGQRIALACIGDSLYVKQYPALAERFKDAGVFGVTLTASILYMTTSGCTASTQYGYAEMLNLACDGVIDFISDVRDYEVRAARTKEIFARYGFHVVYERDVTQPVGDGFFYTIAYGSLSGGSLVVELMKYGISCISLSTTGSHEEGVRVCVSLVSDESYSLLSSRLSAFAADHPLL